MSGVFCMAWLFLTKCREDILEFLIRVVFAKVFDVDIGELHSFGAKLHFSFFTGLEMANKTANRHKPITDWTVKNDEVIWVWAGKSQNTPRQLGDRHHEHVNLQVIQKTITINIHIRHKSSLLLSQHTNAYWLKKNKNKDNKSRQTIYSLTYTRPNALYPTANCLLLGQCQIPNDSLSLDWTTKLKCITVVFKMHFMANASVSIR